MTNNDVVQKLALLPEGLAERNIQSWNKAVAFYEKGLDNWEYEYHPYFDDVHKIAIAFSMSEQAKLFRAGESASNLIISTSDEQDLKNGEPFVSVFFSGGVLIAQYHINDPTRVNILKRISGNNFGVGDDAMTILQPLLDLFWDETRGKKIA